MTYKMRKPLIKNKYNLTIKQLKKYEVLLESLKHYAEHGVGEISTYEAGQIAELLESQHAEITMLRKMQPVVLSGDSAKSFSLLFLDGLDQSTVDKTMEEWLSDVEKNLNYKHWLFGHFHANREINDKGNNAVWENYFN